MSQFSIICITFAKTYLVSKSSQKHGGIFMSFIEKELKTMGTTLDGLCRPAEACHCPISLVEGDWFYDPSDPTKVYQKGSNSNTAYCCNDGDTFVNLASGLKYSYSLTEGMVLLGFYAANKTYYICEEIVGALTMPAKCTIVFEGGRFTGSLKGDNTTIVAGPVQIFDVNLTLNGTFTNEFAYPEWWGAQTERILSEQEDPNHIHNYYNCRAGIQAALDSIFGTIHFCPGFYYVSEAVARDNHELALLYLNKTKALRLSGKGHRGSNLLDDGLTSVIWTNQNNNLLIVNVMTASPEVTGTTTIEGGEFNVCECPAFSHTAVLIYPTILMQFALSTTIIGPIGYVGRDMDESLIWPSTTECPNDEVIDNGYKGYGIRFRHNPYKLDNSDEMKLKTGLKKGVCYLSQVESTIYGFGHGVTIDYSNIAADMTSLVLQGLIDNCFRYLYAPSRAFNGGVVACVIQTRHQNASNGFKEAIVQGDFTEAFIDPEVWDLDPDIDYFSFTPNSRRMRFGQRILNHMAHQSQYGGLENRFPLERIWLSSIQPDNPVSPNENWEKQVKGLSSVLGSDCGAVMCGLGNFDLNGLSASNASSLSPNYVHLLDNDLLSIDSMESDFAITIEKRNISPYFNDSFYGNHYIDGIWKPGTSPFDRDGMIFTFDDRVSIADAQLIVNIAFPPVRHLLQFLAIHLKGAAYNHFDTLQVELRHSTREPDTSGYLEYISILYYGSYADVAQQDGLRDIILPFYFKNSDHYHYPVSMKLTFSGFVKNSMNWWATHGIETFKFSIEGRYHRHYNHHVFTSSGGSLGKPLTKLGKLFISGTETYGNLFELPSDAANGAMATVGIGSVLTNYPVVKTNQGWMIQGLVGDSQFLMSIMNQIGTLSIGQQAFDTTLGKPMWWDGNHWVDAAGNV